MKTWIILTTLIAGLSAQATPLKVKRSEIEGKSSLIAIAQRSVNGNSKTILIDDQGMSLYTFAIDSVNKSKCSGECLTEWPPEHVRPNATVQAPFGTIQGNDGQPQLTLNGLPLYHYDDDKQPGDVFGQYPQWDTIEVLN